MASPAEHDRELFEGWLTGSLERVNRHSRALAGGPCALVASAESRGGAVRVTVTGDGGLTDLTLGDEVRHWPVTEIAHHVLRCVQQAQTRLADHALDHLAERLGDGAAR